MATEDWRWQGGGPANENMKGVAAGGNGTIVAVGRTDGDFFPFASLGGFDFLAVKIGPDGLYLWHWQDGTSDEDNLNDAVVNSDGSVVLAGSTEGDWGGTNAGLGDFAAVKLDESGAVLWKWQSGTSDDELLVGITSANSASGSEVVLVGRTEGSWAASNAGGYDFCAAKLDADGNELWSWQDGTGADDTTKAVAVDGDGSVFLAGYTEGDWNQPNEGETDFAVTKLEANGTLAWRWQGWLEAANNEDNWCTWFLILLKFELILVLFSWWAIILIVGATWVVICQNIGLFMKALRGASEQSLKEEEEKLSQRQSYMNSIKFVEAALESVPQLSFQTYVFFRFGGDPMRFTVSALLAIGSIVLALYLFLTTSEEMKAALNMFRAIFRRDGAPAVAAAPAAAPAAVLPPPPPPLFSRRP